MRSEYSLEDLLDWWKDPNRVISGKDIITEFLELKVHSDNNLDTRVYMFYSKFEKILDINPGYDEASTRFQENDFGLKKLPEVISYFRNQKIDAII